MRSERVKRWSTKKVVTISCISLSFSHWQSSNFYQDKKLKQPYALRYIMPACSSAVFFFYSRGLFNFFFGKSILVNVKNRTIRDAQQCNEFRQQRVIGFEWKQSTLYILWKRRVSLDMAPTYTYNETSSRRSQTISEKMATVSDLEICMDSRRIKLWHALIRPRLSPYTAMIPAILQDLRLSSSFTKLYIAASECFSGEIHTWFDLRHFLGEYFTAASCKNFFFPTSSQQLSMKSEGRA